MLMDDILLLGLARQTGEEGRRLATKLILLPPVYLCYRLSFPGQEDVGTINSHLERELESGPMEGRSTDCVRVKGKNVVPMPVSNR